MQKEAEKSKKIQTDRSSNLNYVWITLLGRNPGIVDHISYKKTDAILKRERPSSVLIEDRPTGIIE